MGNLKKNKTHICKILFSTIVCLAFIGANAQNHLINYVSFNSQNNVVINWSPGSNSTPALSLSIFRRFDTQPTAAPIFTIHNSEFSNYEVASGIYEYEDNSFQTNPPLNFISYSITSYVSAGQTLDPSSAYHAAPFLLPAIVSDYCNSRVQLSWLNYKVFSHTGSGFDPLPAPFDSLRVQYSTDGGATFTTAASLPHPQISTTSQNQDVQLPGPGNYHFRIQAYNSNTRVTSSSNIRQVTFNPPQINNLAINHIDVFENQEIRVYWDASGETGDFIYHLFRNSSPSGVFEQVTTRPNVAPFTDTPEIARGPWFYKVSCFLRQNACTIPAFESQGNHSSIFLTASINLSESRIYAAWQHESPTSWNYQVQQLENGTWQNVSLTQTATNQGYYEIDLGQVAGTVTLRTMATTVGASTIIHSNYAFIRVEPQIYIPNAFRPTSATSDNTVFKPIIPGYNPVEYQLIVFNRWGLKIFESNDKNIGWDGTMSGSIAQPDTYPYLIRFSGLDGETIERRGVVVLVR